MNEIDERYYVPLRESAADVVVEQHIANGGLTGPYFPTVYWDIEDVDNQADQTKYLEASIADTIVWGVAGIIARPTTGNYSGRQIEMDSSKIADLSLTQIPVAEYLQPDCSLFITDQDGRQITNDEEGIPTYFLNGNAAPMFLRDPFVIPNSKKLKLTLRFLRNAGFEGRATMFFYATLLYGGKATAR